MLRIYALSILMSCMGTLLIAQNTKTPLIAPTKAPLSEVDKVVMPPVDNEVLLEAEMARRRPGVAPQFAKAFEVDISPETHGNWETLDNGLVVWRLIIVSKNAYSINLGFSEYYMPKGSQMIFYTPDKERIMGPFTKADNEEHAQLWTPIFEGDRLVIEVSLPARLKSALNLRLIAVNHDFLNFSKISASGSCNLDVVCSADDGWEINDIYRDAIQSVGIYGFGGTNFCTGFLINTTANDCRPYFMTAFHCGVTTNNAPSVVVYWNYQNSTCRTPRSSSSGNPGNGRLQELNSGARLVSTYRRSDFTLLELDDEVPESANAYFAGWTRESTPPKDTVICIHHPNSSEKRISYSFQTTFMGEWASEDTPVPDGDHIVVPRWDIGTTEVGSSGGPLLNKKGQVVGQLHGGFADCNNFFYDSFGAFSVSWTGGRSNFSSLGPHLDPIKSNAQSIDGRLQRVCAYNLTPSVVRQEICLPDTALYLITLSDNFTLPVTLRAEGLPLGMEAAFSQNPAIAGQTVQIRVTAVDTFPSGIYTFTVFGSSNEEVVSTSLELHISSSLPGKSQLVKPADQMTDVTSVINFVWEKQEVFTSYHLQISRDSLFNALVADLTFIDTNQVQYEVSPEQQYFWRVRAENICGNGSWSEVRAFRTADIACDQRVSNDLPKSLSVEGTSSVTSTIHFRNPGQITKISIEDLDIDHTFIGDLKATLTAPSGKVIRLFDRIGSPEIIFGCDGDDIKVSFSDEAGQTADALENICNNKPAVSGTFQPIDPFSNLVGEPAAGIWTLKIEDISNQDGGQLNGWKLNICATQPKGILLTPSTQRMELCAGREAAFDLLIGSGFDAAGATLSHQGLPSEASLQFSQNPVEPGSTVTIAVGGLITPGDYPLEILASDSTNIFSTQIIIRVVTQPDQPTLQTPEPEELLLTATPSLTWRDSEAAVTYTLEVARDNLFTDTILVEQLTSSSYTFLEPLSPGIYYWRVAAGNACDRFISEVRSFDISTTEVDAPVPIRLMLYPNPARDQLTLDFGGATVHELGWRIRAVNGQILLNGREPLAGMTTINLSDLPEGLYLLEITSKDFSVVRKIIKQE